MQELLKELEIVTQGELNDSTRSQILDKTTEKLGAGIAGEFGVQANEVAILIISNRQGILKFEYPKPLRNSGTIPLKGKVSAKDAIALRSVSSRRGEIINAVQQVKHLAVFEMVKTSSGTPMPIQKMLSVPILAGQDPIGVVQVSRKGENPAKAGVDFSDTDLKKLEKISAAVAPYLARVIPTTY
ncbi:MAG: hypothetical protein HYX75_04650 [Acidobacteria bacterium]|nr:hypothetical protein [Acidobacteriota bacterium]